MTDLASVLPASMRGTVAGPGEPLTLDAPELAELVRARIEAALGRLAPGSRGQYRRTLRLFASWASSRAGDEATPSPAGAVVSLLRAGPLVAATVVEEFLSDGCAGRAPATVAQRLAAIRWAVRLAREAGLVPWDLHVRGPRVTAYRNTAGPSLDAFRAVLQAVESLPEEERLRDRVLLGLLFVLGLRRGEIAALRVGSADLDRRRLLIIGKGRQEPEPVALPVALAERVAAYLAYRGELPPDAPLLANRDRAGKGDGRLTPSGIYKRVKLLAARAEVRSRVTPHGLRHGAITAALDALNGDVRRVRSFARHAKTDTTLIYDDRRRDVAGEVADVLAGLCGLHAVAAASDPASGSPDADQDPTKEPRE